MKKCGKCGKTKPLDEFHRHNGRPDGRQYSCKNCERQRSTTPEYQAYRRRYRLEYLYGISEDEYNQLLLKQGGRCAICRTDVPPGTRPWYVDHDHESGAKRGLLCSSCNTILGLAHDDVSVLLAAVEYLKAAA